MNIKTSKCLVFISILLITWSMAGCARNQGKISNGKIIFQSNRNGNYNLFIMNPDGSDQRKLTDFPNNKFAPDDNNGFFLSPDGRKIAYSSDEEGNFEIYVVDIDSYSQINLTNNAADESSFAWSPDGKQIAFVSDRDSVLIDLENGLRTNNIYIMNADGSNTRRLTTDNTTEQYGLLSWSPDQKKLAGDVSFQSPGPSVSLIYLLTLSDAKQTLLTSPDGMVQGVGTWSPNGEQLLYFKGGSMSENVYVMNADGSHQLALSNDDLGMVTEASWSPDGTRVVFSTLKLQGDNKYYFLYTVKADGNDLISLSKNPLSFDTSPSWSPDGKYIVFASKRDGGKYHLFVMNPDGTNQRQLTNGPGEEAAPIWSPVP